MMDERRKYIRIDVCIETNYEIMPMSQGMFSARSMNISEGGMCFLADKKIDSGTVLRLWFSLPDATATRIECLGRVIWQKVADDGFVTGIEFRDQDISKQTKLSVFVLRFFKDMETSVLERPLEGRGN